MVKRILVLIFWLMAASLSEVSAQQDTVFILEKEQLTESEWLRLPPITKWKFKKGSEPGWAAPELDDHDWIRMDSATIASLTYDENGKFEGWFRFRFRFQPDFEAYPFFLRSTNTAAQDIYLDGKKVFSFGNTGLESGSYRRSTGEMEALFLEPGREYTMAVHFFDRIGPLSRSFTNPVVFGSESFLWFITSGNNSRINKARSDQHRETTTLFTILISISLLFWLIWGLNRGQKHLFFIALFTTACSLFPLGVLLFYTDSSAIVLNEEWPAFNIILSGLAPGAFTTTFLLVLSSIFLDRIPRWIKFTCVFLFFICAPLFILYGRTNDLIGQGIPLFASGINLLALGYIIYKGWKNTKGAKRIIALGLLITSLLFIGSFLIGNFAPEYTNYIPFYLSLLTFPIFLLIYVAFWFKENRLQEREKAAEVIRITREKEEILKTQNVRLEQEVENRTKELNNSLKSLKDTQTQLVHSEKMASLGELTAGIAHEIQNPLNFVNNFSEVSSELLQEMNEELDKGEIHEAIAIAEDLKRNLEKINQHGKRADGIVKGMLQHSRSGDGKKEPTDLNALADEYLRLAYHGLRAKDKSFNAAMETDFDPDVGKISVVPQELGRVILNLLTNAFYAVNEKKKEGITGYEPTVKIRTHKTKQGVDIHVTDNGNGIPEKVREKVFQPFFSTKPTGEGTGLGLSMSYDIITKGHGGDLKVQSENGKGTTFTIHLPHGKNTSVSK
jgi:signal transduction histidine kinase